MEAIGEEAQKTAATNGVKDQSGNLLVPGFQQGQVIGRFEAADYFISEGAKVLGKPSLAAKFSPRVEAAKANKDTGEAIVKDFLTEVKQIGYEAGLKDGAKGITEQAKLEERKGQGPPKPAGTSSSGRPSPQEYAAATREQRSEWREKGIEPLVQ